MIQRLLEIASRIVCFIVLYQSFPLHGLQNQKTANLCPPGHYGKACENLCPLKCAQACDRDGLCFNCSIPGVQLPHCTEECIVGFYGPNCALACSSECQNQDCDSISGECKVCSRTGLRLPSCNVTCLPGTFGLHCQNRCPLSCKEKCDAVSGDCTECPHGDGPKCTVNCATADDAEACRLYCSSQCLSWCNTTDGTCSLCAPGYQPPLCQEPCDGGFYGSNCKEKCSIRCKNETCDPFNGICYSCNAGYVGRRCNGQCVPGLFGQDCLLPCPETCAQSLCHFATGDCVKCLPGYSGRLCEQLCGDGRYGENCKFQCPTACEGKCDPVTGKCWQCSPGNAGAFCNQTCRNGTYGLYCAKLCPAQCLNGVCHAVSGRCAACEGEYSGPFCDTMPSESSSKSTKAELIVYVFFGLFSTLVALGLAMVFYQRKIKRDMLKLKRPTERTKANHILRGRQTTSDITGLAYLAKENCAGESTRVNLSRSERNLLAGTDSVSVSSEKLRKEDVKRFPSFLHFEDRLKSLSRAVRINQGSGGSEREKSGIDAVLSELKEKQKSNLAKLSTVQTVSDSKLPTISTRILAGAPTEASDSTSKDKEDARLLPKTKQCDAVTSKGFPASVSVSSPHYPTCEYVTDTEQQPLAESERRTIHLDGTSRLHDKCVKPTHSKVATAPRLAVSEFLDKPRVTENVSIPFAGVDPSSHPIMKLQGPSEIILTHSTKYQHSPSDKVGSVDTLYSIASTEFSQMTPTYAQDDTVPRTDHENYCQCDQHGVPLDMLELLPSTSSHSAAFSTAVSFTRSSAVTQSNFSLQSSNVGSYTHTFYPSKSSSYVIKKKASIRSGKASTHCEEKTCTCISGQKSRPCQICKTNYLEKETTDEQGHTSKPAESLDGSDKLDRSHSVSSQHFAVIPQAGPERSSDTLGESFNNEPRLLENMRSETKHQCHQASEVVADSTQETGFMSVFDDNNMTDELRHISLASNSLHTSSKASHKTTKSSTRSENLSIKPPSSQKHLSQHSAHKHLKVYSDMSPPKSTDSVTGQESIDGNTEEDFSAASEIYHHSKRSDTAQGGSTSSLVMNERSAKRPIISVSGTLPTSTWVNQKDNVSPMLMRCSTTRQLSPMYSHKTGPHVTTRLQPLPTPPPEGRSSLRPVKKTSASSLNIPDS